MAERVGVNAFGSKSPSVGGVPMVAYSGMCSRAGAVA